MHKASYKIMKYFADHYLDPKLKLDILDVGSQDVNGCFRDLFNKWNYTGLDIAPGKNVDIVSKSHYDFGLTKLFDVVITGNTFEHVEAPWLLMNEIEKVLKADGLLCVTVPFSIGEHRYPIDCWRILPDGFRYLLKNFKILECQMVVNLEGYRFFSARPRLLWIIKILPKALRKIFEVYVTDTYAIARKLP